MNSTLRAPLPARFLVLALSALALVAVLAPMAIPLLLGGFYDRGLVAFVHLSTLGIVAAAIMGASHQVIPCALTVPVTSGRIASISFWLHAAGLPIFLLGFYQTWHPVLATGALLLAAGLSLYITMLMRGLRRAGDLDIVG